MGRLIKSRLSFFSTTLTGLSRFALPFAFLLPALLAAEAPPSHSSPSKSQLRPKLISAYPPGGGPPLEVTAGQARELDELLGELIDNGFTLVPIPYFLGGNEDRESALRNFEYPKLKRLLVLRSGETLADTADFRTNLLKMADRLEKLAQSREDQFQSLRGISKDKLYNYLEVRARSLFETSRRDFEPTRLGKILRSYLTTEETLLEDVTAATTFFQASLPPEYPRWAIKNYLKRRKRLLPNIEQRTELDSAYKELQPAIHASAREGVATLLEPMHSRVNNALDRTRDQKIPIDTILLYLAEREHEHVAPRRIKWQTPFTPKEPEIKSCEQRAVEFAQVILRHDRRWGPGACEKFCQEKFCTEELLASIADYTKKFKEDQVTRHEIEDFERLFSLAKDQASSNAAFFDEWGTVATKLKQNDSIANLRSYDEALAKIRGKYRALQVRTADLAFALKHDHPASISAEAVESLASVLEEQEDLLANIHAQLAHAGAANFLPLPAPIDLAMGAAPAKSVAEGKKGSVTRETVLQSANTGNSRSSPIDGGTLKGGGEPAPLRMQQSVDPFAPARQMQAYRVWLTKESEEHATDFRNRIKLFDKALLEKRKFQLERARLTSGSAHRSLDLSKERLRKIPGELPVHSDWRSPQGQEIRHDVAEAQGAYKILTDRAQDETTKALLAPLSRIYSDVLTEASVADALSARGLGSFADSILKSLKEKADFLSGVGKGVLASGKELKDILVDLYEHKGELWKKVSNKYERFLVDARYSGPDHAVASMMADAFNSTKDAAAQISKTVRERRNTLLFGTPEQRGEVIGKTAFEVASALVGESAAAKIAGNPSFKEAVARCSLSQCVKDATNEALKAGKLPPEAGKVLTRSADILPRTTSEIIRQGSGAAESFAAGIKGTDKFPANRKMLCSSDETIAELAKSNPGRAGSIIDSSSSGTIWDSIRPTQPVYPGSVIPKSFELTTEHGKYWVHGNATKHLAEYAGSKAIGSTPEAARLASQTHLASLQAAVETAAKKGIKYGEMIEIGGWKLKFGPPRETGQLPVLIHALFQ